jgi:hypothetical protein
MKTLLLAGLALVLTLGFSCGGDDRDSGELPPDGRNAHMDSCASDRDCGSGQGCYQARSVCMPFPSGDQAFTVLVDPVVDQILVADQFDGVSVGTSGSLDLTLTEPVILQGSVFHASSVQAWLDSDMGLTPSTPEQDSNLVEGRIVATADGRIPGTGFRSEAPVRPGTDGGAPAFQIRLMPGVRYSATFVPAKSSGTALPPHHFVMQASTSATRNILLPPIESYVTIEGIVRSGVIVRTPIPDAVVASRLGANRVGTSAVTDENGLFTVLLPPGEGSVTLEVRPGKDGPLFPAREILWPGGLAELADEFATNPLLHVDVEPVPAVRQVSLQVLGRDNGNEIPVPSTRVMFSGRSGEGTVTASALADEAGIVTVTLLEGAYDVAAIPPAESRFATNHTQMDLGIHPNQAFLQYLEPRVVVSGTVVRDADGLPVPGSEVVLLSDRLDSIGAVFAGAFDVAFQTVADADGAFQVPVDPGHYAIRVTPPATSGLAVSAQPSLDLTSSRSLTVPLPDGVLVRGRIVSAPGAQAVVRARVRFHHDIRGAGLDWWSLQQTSFAADLLRVAEATTDDNGRFEVIVPSLSKVPGNGQAPDAGYNGPGKDDPSGGESGFPVPGIEID